MEWPVLGRKRAPAEQRAMEWPVLGRKRALPTQEEKPAKSATRASTAGKPKTMAHWNFKLATVFGKFQLPEEVEAMIEAFAMRPQFKAFREKYGSQVAMYHGRGFVSDWHPRIASKTRERYIWEAFSKNILDTLTRKTVETLEGKMVLIIYRNKQGSTTRMDPKRVTHAGPYSMAVDHGPGYDGSEFTLSYTGVQRIDLYVDVRL